MNRKSKKKFKEWAKNKNEEYAQSRIKYILDKGFPMKAGRSVLSKAKQDKNK